METAENVDYLGLRHYRFYIRCPLCCAEIIWRVSSLSFIFYVNCCSQTDLESGDYVLESGAKRNFEALKTAEELEAKRQAEEEEELANNPMKLLEKRTDQSKQEMEMVEVIEDLKQLNQRQATMEADHVLLRQMWREEEAVKEAEKEADDALIKQNTFLPSYFISKGNYLLQNPSKSTHYHCSLEVKIPLSQSEYQVHDVISNCLFFLALKDLMKVNRKEPVEVSRIYFNDVQKFFSQVS